MRLRLSLGLGTVALLALVAIGVSSAGHVPTPATRSPAAAAADCSKETATQLVNQHRLNNFLLPNPVQQVLCGPFTGPGSEAMVVTIAAPTCWSPQRWAVFRSVGGSWQLVLDQSEFVVSPVVAVGSDIRVTAPVFHPGDPRCLSSGGTHARVWHWDGSSLVPGPWKPVTKGEAKSQNFYSPSRNLTCSMADDMQARRVICWSDKAPQRVEMDVNGRLKICHGRRCVFACGCKEPFPILRYGRQMTVGRFRCLSLTSGFRCIVIQSGRGFLINRTAINRVGQ